MSRLVLLRHGESLANAGDAFAGRLDVPLTAAGAEEVRAAAGSLTGWRPSAVHSSRLSRAVDSAVILRDVLCPDVAVSRWASLDERHYGVLQGMPREEARRRYGEACVARWRRSTTGRPPGGESLMMVHARLAAYWREVLAPLLTTGHAVVVVAHGNSLRMLVAHVSGLGVEEAAGLEVPTATPLRPEVRLPAR